MGALAESDAQPLRDPTSSYQQWCVWLVLRFLLVLGSQFPGVFFLVEEEIASEFFLNEDFSFGRSASELVTLHEKEHEINKSTYTDMASIAALMTSF